MNPTSYRHTLALTAALTLPLLASCAADTGQPLPNEKPFMQTDSGSLPVTGKEPTLPNNPGYNPDAPMIPRDAGDVQGGPNSPGYLPPGR